MCPVCREATQVVEVLPEWGERRQCLACTLEFVNPLVLGEDPRALFDDAYQGRVQTSAMEDFHQRRAQRRVILDKLHDPALWFWTPAFHEVLDWLSEHLAPGDTVLELGCGLGFFLHALRQRGFDAVGLDVAETVVDINREDGFRVWHGPIESMPFGWVRPAAVVSFFMLHHLEDPLGYLRAIRQHAPDAPLGIAAYGPTNKGTEASLPPRTLTRWNERSLATALELAGYEPRVREIASTGSERQWLSPIRTALSRVTRGLPPAYRIGKRIESRLLETLPDQARQEGYVLVALAQPAPEPVPS